MSKIINPLNPGNVEGEGKCSKCGGEIEKSPDGDIFSPDTCLGCTLAEMADDVGALMTHCTNCGAYVMMKRNEKTEGIIDGFKGAHGENAKYTLMSVDICIECDPKYETQRAERKAQMDQQIADAEKDYQEHLREQAPGKAGDKFRALKAMREAAYGVARGK